MAGRGGRASIKVVDQNNNSAFVIIPTIVLVFSISLEDRNAHRRVDGINRRNPFNGRAKTSPKIGLLE